MPGFVETGGLLLVGLALGIGGVLAFWQLRKMFQASVKSDATTLRDLIRLHFAPASFDQITVTERKFPSLVRADLQNAINRLFDDTTTVIFFCGVKKEYSHEQLGLADCFVASKHNSVVSVPPQYESIDIGDQEPVRCLTNGLWFLEQNGQRYLVLMAPAGHFAQADGMQFQIGTINNPAGTKLAQQFFRHLEESVMQAESYRGKILSLQQRGHNYSGKSSGISVHKLRTVERDQVILSRKTLELLDRNIIQFVQLRPGLTRFRQSTKKGLLFYGPPGTGKTHTIHYLARALPDHTTLLITAEQVGLLSEYMTLARLLQPSIVVMEDVDLIARQRTRMGSVCEEVLLNQLLNEMDGLKESADILFILTTNRPQELEYALASRPGRIDQAIEFPLPDEEGREKLVKLYSQGIEVSDEIVKVIVQRTDQVSAAFIKELMRRSAQYHLERNGTDTIQLADVEMALEEMLFSGGSLNLKLLGADGMRTSEPA